MPGPQRVGPPGQIIILNGTPRSGKSSIAAAIQTTFEGVWMNLGGDRFKPMTPERYQPRIGLRPGGERPHLEALVVVLYRAMYQAIAAHSRMGLNVVVDVGHHDAYSVPLGILPDCARRLSGLPGYRDHHGATAGYLGCRPRPPTARFVDARYMDGLLPETHRRRQPGGRHLSYEPGGVRLPRMQ
jgi:hypothetical protein